MIIPRILLPVIVLLGFVTVSCDESESFPDDPKTSIPKDIPHGWIKFEYTFDYDSLMLNKAYVKYAYSVALANMAIKRVDTDGYYTIYGDYWDQHLSSLVKILPPFLPGDYFVEITMFGHCLNGETFNLHTGNIYFTINPSDTTTVTVSEFKNIRL